MESGVCSYVSDASGTLMAHDKSVLSSDNLILHMVDYTCTNMSGVAQSYGIER